MVTGGASGLGRATALALAAEGVEVVVADVDEDGGRAVAEQVGGHFVATDVSSLDANLALVEAAVDLAGGVDIAYLNAGVATGFGVGPEFVWNRDPRLGGMACVIQSDGEHLRRSWRRRTEPRLVEILRLSVGGRGQSSSSSQRP